MTHKEKATALAGGRQVNILREVRPDEPAVPETVKVRQIPVRDYDAGFVLADDEAALAGFLCGKDRPWALTLTPESFEEVLETGREVNQRGFFSCYQRRSDRARKQETEAMARIAALPFETQKLILENGQKLASPTTSPALLPPPVR